MPMIGNGLNDDMELFKSRYKVSPKEYINGFSSRDVIRIDLRDKVVIALESELIRKSLPADIMGVFIDEGEYRGYSAELIYAGHIAFIHIKFENDDKKERYFFKDDECLPQEAYEWEEDSSALYEWVEGRQRDKEEMYDYMEKFIQVNLMDIDFRLDKDNLIMLEGL